MTKNQIIKKNNFNLIGIISKKSIDLVLLSNKSKYIYTYHASCAVLNHKNFTWRLWYRSYDYRLYRKKPEILPKRIQANVMSKIDYCDSLLNGIPEKQLSRIQLIQNCVARVVLRLHRFS